MEVSYQLRCFYMAHSYKAELAMIPLNKLQPGLTRLCQRGSLPEANLKCMHHKLSWEFQHMMGISRSHGSGLTMVKPASITVSTQISIARLKTPRISQKLNLHVPKYLTTLFLNLYGDDREIIMLQLMFSINWLHRCKPNKYSKSFISLWTTMHLMALILQRPISLKH